MRTENVVLEYSVGAFEEGELVAFILHFSRDTINKKIVYNGGTGVIPKNEEMHLLLKCMNSFYPI